MASSHALKLNSEARLSDVTIASCLILFIIVVPALFHPEESGGFLDWLNGISISIFGHWYIWLLAFASFLSIVLAAWPRIGNLKLGRADDKPEYSMFSWISMIYGAGVSAALLKWSVAEPMNYLQDNPEVIKGITTVGTDENFRMAMKWAFMHWGISAWSCYAITGLAIAFTCYRNNKPLNVGSALSPLLGQNIATSIAKKIDVMIVLVGMLCMLQVLSFGVEQIKANLLWIGLDNSFISFSQSTLVLVATVGIVCTTSMGCILSGLQRGIKWISVANMQFSVLLLGLLLATSSFSGLKILVICVFDYITAFPEMALGIWHSDSQLTSETKLLEEWQRKWSLFHWTWWIPFTGFVGLFMARVSRGRTVREFIVGTMLVPSLICIVWLSWAGGIAMQLETSAIGGIELASVDNANKILAMIQYLYTPTTALLLYALVIILIGTYLITTVSSGLLVSKSLMTHDNKTAQPAQSDIALWGLLLVTLPFLINQFNATAAIQAAMCLFALPTSALIAALCGSLIKSVVSETFKGDSRRA